MPRQDPRWPDAPYRAISAAGRQDGAPVKYSNSADFPNSAGLDQDDMIAVRTATDLGAEIYLFSLSGARPPKPFLHPARNLVQNVSIFLLRSMVDNLDERRSSDSLSCPATMTAGHPLAPISILPTPSRWHKGSRM